MTTTVVVTCPKPNHKAVRVRVGYVQPDGTVATTANQMVLQHGESTTVHVYDGNQVILDEFELPVVDVAR